MKNITLEELSSYFSSTQAGVHIIVSADTQISFLSRYAQQACKQSKILSFTFLPFPSKQEGVRGYHATLDQAFLGEKGRYITFCSQAVNVSSSLKKQLYAYLTHYNGPHNVYLIVSQDDMSLLPASLMRRALLFEEVLQFSDLSLLANVFQYHHAVKISNWLIRHYHGVSFTPAQALCLLDHLEYMPVKNIQAFMKYLPALLPEHASLVEVADAWFAGDKKRFYTFFQDIFHEYPEMFWIKFWSEQLWRAWWVTYFVRKREFSLARKMNFRLPGKFFHVYVHKMKLESLENAFSKLTLLDSRIKEGSSWSIYDVFTLLSL